MQQQQKAQKIGNQRKSINSYTNKKKIWLKWSSRPNQCVVTKKPTLRKIVHKQHKNSMHQKNNTYFLVSHLSVPSAQHESEDNYTSLGSSPKMERTGHWISLRTPQTQNCCNVCAFLQLPESGLFFFFPFDVFSAFDVFHRHRVCVINPVYLICSMQNLLEDS